MDYKGSGVDISAGDETVKQLKPLVKKTFNKNVLSELGSFAGFYAIEKGNWYEPVLVSSTDGVGTKLCIAESAGRYNTIGRDLVNHCVNDIFVHGAKPLFFLDYIGTGKMKPNKIRKIVEGLVDACKEHEMALIGGETAEMPGIYHNDDFDLAGTIVGCVEREMIINGKDIREEDYVIGFTSSGIHTNGYSLVRKLLHNSENSANGYKTSQQVAKNPGLTEYIEAFGKTLEEELLTVHRSYYHKLKGYATPQKIHGMAHVTGGGIAGNLTRIIPDGLRAVIDCQSWEELPVFSFLQELGNIADKEMFRVFNMGIGFIAVVPSSTVSELCDLEQGIVIGRIEKLPLKRPQRENEEERVVLKKNRS